MPELAASTLQFDDRKVDGRVVVSDANGAPVAYIRRGMFGGRFEATDAAGSPLCAGRRYALSRCYDFADADGHRLGQLKEGGNRHAVSLVDGRSFTIAKRWFGQGWVLVDEADNLALWCIRTSARGRTWDELETGRLPRDGPSFRGHRYERTRWPDTVREEWLVTPDGSLPLAQLVAIVESYRRVVKADRKHVSPP